MTETVERGERYGGTLQVKDGEDGWGVSGFASTWDRDEGGDVILKGAFAESLRSNPKPPLLFHHKHDQVVGVARRLEETPEGLWGEWRLSRTALGQDTRELVRDGALSGLSIGYTIPPGGAERKGDTRYLRTVRLLETSIVAFPMNLGARIATVKEAPLAPVLRELEALLETKRRRHRLATLDALTTGSAQDRHRRDRLGDALRQAQLRVVQYRLAIKAARV
jgi:HK97 family phage prohead protease